MSKVKKRVKKLEFRVYFLQNERKSYIGFTTDLPHRIRQHRGEIKGGAKCTTSWKHPENTEIVAFITGFPTQKSALSYEWHAKRRRSPKQELFDGLTPPCHNRLYRFFEPLLNPKFQDIKQELQIVLLKHHELQGKIITHFEVDCAVSIN
jgi:predicted GIY-YIG superfamily endonuclease